MTLSLFFVKKHYVKTSMSIILNLNFFRFTKLIVRFMEIMVFKNGKLVVCFLSRMKQTVRLIGEDVRCDVHQTVLGIREGKEGWFHLYCPGGIACDDDGELFGGVVSVLIGSCNIEEKMDCFSGMLFVVACFRARSANSTFSVFGSVVSISMW